MTDSIEMEHKKDKIINKEFKIARLNKLGTSKFEHISLKFDDLLLELMMTCADCRELALVRTKMEEASFFVFKALVTDPRYQKKEED